MKRLLVAAFMACLMLPVGVATTRADLAPFGPRPKPPKAPTTEKLTIVVNDTLKEAKLLLPAELAKNLRGDLGQANDTVVGMEDTGINTRQVMIGGALAVALVTGGLWVKKNKPGKTGILMIFLGAVVLFAGAGLALANVGPLPGEKGHKGTPWGGIFGIKVGTVLTEVQAEITSSPNQQGIMLMLPPGVWPNTDKKDADKKDTEKK